MDVNDLRAELQRLEVPEFAYSIDKISDESCSLIQEDDGWHVFYSERGDRNTEEVFGNESAACEELKRRVVGDGTVRGYIEDAGIAPRGRPGY